MTTLSIVIPCCNEEDALAVLPERLFPVLSSLAMQHDIQLVLIDDGSADATWQRLTALREDTPWPTVLMRHQQNSGLGVALRHGCELATGEIVVTLDADGTYPFTLIAPLVAEIVAGADVATVSPYHRAGGVEGVSAARLLFSRGASCCYRLLVDRRIATYTAMVRAYRAEVLAAVSVDHPGFLAVTMILVEARRREARIAEVPAVLSQRQLGVSKAKVARITRSHLAYLARIVGLRLTGRYQLAPTASRLGAAKLEAAGAVQHD